MVWGEESMWGLCSLLYNCYHQICFKLLVFVLFILPFSFPHPPTFHLDFIVPSTPSCRSLPSLSLFFPNPSERVAEVWDHFPSGWLSCYMSLSSLGTETWGGSLFQKHTTLRLTTLCIINSWARGCGRLHQQRSVFYWAWQGSTYI